MALKIDYTNEQTGVSYKDTYHKINFLVFNFRTENASFEVAIYASQEARKENKKPLATHLIQCNKDAYNLYFQMTDENYQGTNPLKQAYEYLKTLNDEDLGLNYREDSSDVLEG